MYISLMVLLCTIADANSINPNNISGLINSSNANVFTILSSSTYDSTRYNWWKWFMPTYYEDYLQYGMKKETQLSPKLIKLLRKQEEIEKAMHMNQNNGEEKEDRETEKKHGDEVDNRIEEDAQEISLISHILNGVNEEDKTGENGWTDGSICQLRFYAVADSSKKRTLNIEEYVNGGYGVLADMNAVKASKKNVLLSNRNAFSRESMSGMGVRIDSHATGGVQCFYNSNKNTLSDTTQNPLNNNIEDNVESESDGVDEDAGIGNVLVNAVSFAIYCPVMPYHVLYKFDKRSGQDVGRVGFGMQSSDVCPYLNENTKLYAMKLYPSGRPAEENFHKNSTHQFQRTTSPMLFRDAVLPVDEPIYKPDGSGVIERIARHVYRAYISTPVPYEYGLNIRYSPYSDASGMKSTRNSENVVDMPVNRHSGQDSYDNIHHYSTRSLNHQLVVCTVQTFQSPTSGPNLYLFARYHSRVLGLTVVIYDRFGAHYDHIKDLFLSEEDERKIAEEKAEVEGIGGFDLLHKMRENQHSLSNITSDVGMDMAGSHTVRGSIEYYNFTALEKGLPHIYTAKYASAMGKEFKYYYYRDRVHDGLHTGAAAQSESPDGDFSLASAVPEVVEDTLSQDMDKHYTMDMARVTYSHLSKDNGYRMIFLDGDELLVPNRMHPGSKGNYLEQCRVSSNKGKLLEIKPKPYHKSSSSLSMKESLRQHVNGRDGVSGSIMYTYYEEVHYVRYAVASAASYRAVSSSQNTDKRIAQIHVRQPHVDDAAIADMKLIASDGISRLNNVYNYTVDCLNNGYENRDILAMLSCWSSNVIEQKLTKYLDNEHSTCPFHWSHRGCSKYSWESMVKKVSKTMKTRPSTHTKATLRNYKKYKKNKVASENEQIFNEQMKRNNPIGATRIKTNRNRMHIGVPLGNAIARKKSRYENRMDVDAADTNLDAQENSRNSEATSPMESSKLKRVNNTQIANSVYMNVQLPIHASDVKFTPTDIMELGGVKNMCFCNHRYNGLDKEYIILHMNHNQFLSAHRSFYPLAPRNAPDIDKKYVYTQDGVNPLAYMIQLEPSY